MMPQQYCLVNHGQSMGDKVTTGPGSEYGSQGNCAVRGGSASNKTLLMLPGAEYVQQGLIMDRKHHGQQCHNPTRLLQVVGQIMSDNKLQGVLYM